jgi:hypothetical protein
MGAANTMGWLKEVKRARFETGVSCSRIRLQPDIDVGGVGLHMFEDPHTQFRCLWESQMLQASHSRLQYDPARHNRDRIFIDRLQ